jgi:hypothetical protein
VIRLAELGRDVIGAGNRAKLGVNQSDAQPGDRATRKWHPAGLINAARRPTARAFPASLRKAALTIAACLHDAAQ